jgi:hypothetical protein
MAVIKDHAQNGEAAQAVEFREAIREPGGALEVHGRPVE